MKEAVITGAARTAIGSLGGSLAEFSAPKLGAIAAAEAVSRGGIQVFFGVIFTIVAVYGILTPPFGLGLFMASSMTGLSFNRVVKATIPCLIPLVISVIVLILFPWASSRSCRTS